VRQDPPGQTLWWCTRCGMSWQALQVAPTCPDGCAPAEGPPQKAHQGWLRHRQLIIGRRSGEYQTLRSAGLVGAGTATPRIYHPCPGRDGAAGTTHGDTTPTDWRPSNRPCFPPYLSPPGDHVRRAHWRCRSCPACLDPPTTARGSSLLSCGDLEANPGPPPTDWGDEEYAVVPDLVVEACGRLENPPVRNAFATPANHCLTAYWTREDDAFAQP